MLSGVFKGKPKLLSCRQEFLKIDTLNSMMVFSSNPQETLLGMSVLFALTTHPLVLTMAADRVILMHAKNPNIVHSIKPHVELCHHKHLYIDPFKPIH